MAGGISHAIISESVNSMMKRKFPIKIRKKLSPQPQAVQLTEACRPRYD